MLTGKVALITGASRGIGKAIASHLGTMGATVIINYQHNEQLAHEAASEIRSYGGQAQIYQANVCKNEEVKNMMKFIVEHFGQLDILVNNAGIIRDGLIARMSEDDFDEVIETNLKGAYCCIRHAVKPMIKRRHGKIINISSVIALMGNTGQMNYAAAKAGLIGLTKSAAKELASKGIIVNAIAPGFINSEMTCELEAEILNKMLSEIPIGRFGTPEEVASLVGFLVTDAASYMTGQILHLNGGMYMA